MSNEPGATQYTNRWGDGLGPGGREVSQESCSCFDQCRVSNRRRVRFHSERQDTSLPGWQHLLSLIDEAAADGREVFRPLVAMSPHERRQIVTLPPTIAKLTAVKHFVLYGSNLVRIPQEIGAMTSLEEFTPYTSYRLHWVPYELTRCQKLTRSTVSTRALYGNRKFRVPFPPLQSAKVASDGFDLGSVDPGAWGANTLQSCSVCEGLIAEAGPRQVWISLRVATDVLPLLVNACSEACIRAVPAPPQGYIAMPHTGGPGIDQPSRMPG